MHEWALVDALLKCAGRYAQENGLKKVDEVVIVLGDLQNADEACCRDIYNELKADAGALMAASVPVFEREKAEFKCRACGSKIQYAGREKLPPSESEAIHFVPETAGIYIKCPRCGGPDLEITAGRGVHIRELRGEK
ncbi:MAG: hydrogenase/urease maturation nickel metallochaperone HypA [Elusimicrobiaceae bacterium]|nr:hydrogenase/urease maturation nickel metallochaperone HypA [Elusimicrobiaceae bacterium]